MNEQFYQQLVVAVRAAAEKNDAVEIEPAVWQDFCRDSAPAQITPSRSGNPPPPVHAAAPRQAVNPPVPPPTQPEAPVVDLRQADWETLAGLVSSCRRCILCEERHNTVFGEGDIHAELMFVGEGPGQDEDRTGRPFVGRAGQLLDKMITAMTYRREEVYIANVVKCRPPRNRVPSPDEALACIGYLRRQIELVRPKVIVALGGTALSFLLGESASITRMRGNWMTFEGIPVMPTFHPAYLLRQEAAKRDCWHDLQLVMKALGRTRGGQ